MNFHEMSPYGAPRMNDSVRMLIHLLDYRGEWKNKSQEERDHIIDVCLCKKQDHKLSLSAKVEECGGLKYLEEEVDKSDDENLAEILQVWRKALWMIDNGQELAESQRDHEILGKQLGYIS